MPRYGAAGWGSSPGCRSRSPSFCLARRLQPFGALSAVLACAALALGAMLLALIAFTAGWRRGARGMGKRRHRPRPRACPPRLPLRPLSARSLVAARARSHDRSRQSPTTAPAPAAAREGLGPAGRGDHHRCGRAEGRIRAAARRAFERRPELRLAGRRHERLARHDGRNITAPVQGSGAVSPRPLRASSFAGPAMRWYVSSRRKTASASMCASSRDSPGLFCTAMTAISQFISTGSGP